ncbi:MAG: site-2 protease family protein [Planctomycetales bacterium]|nr:site-2 protease family protein [Planctomycetales bacterium]
MGLYLIADALATASTLEVYTQNAWAIFMVVVGLGAVIFVHELGHFLVAKACGVQCDKFYVGFDVAIRIPFLGPILAKLGMPPKSDDGEFRLPAALFRRQWGETEYGIGIIPLGGYVKMLGQDDNPANAAKELERARLHKEKLAAQEGEDAADSSDKPASETDADAAAEAKPSEATADDLGEFNPRSYLAKPVWQRMFIISAGVIMNIIFAFIFATVAYMSGDGVRYMPCVVSEVVPGSPAWRANVQPGDEITKIANTPKPRFQDLKSNVMLGDMENGVPVEISRPGVDGTISLTIRPEKKLSGLPTIGVLNPRTLDLPASVEPVIPGSSAARAEPAFAPGDKLLAANGEPLADNRALTRLLARETDRPIEFRVEREQRDEAGKVTGTEELTIRVAPNPMMRLGLVMDIGPIVAVQAESPAAKVGLQAGDFIELIDDEPVGDPLTLPERLRRKSESQQTVSLRVRRESNDGPSEQLDFLVSLRPAETIETPYAGAPQSVPALGIAYRVLNRISAVLPSSPAAAAGITPGSFVTKAKFVAPAEMDAKLAKTLEKSEILFDEENANWPSLIGLIQHKSLQGVPQGTEILLTVTDGVEKNERSVQLAPAASSDWFVAERGLIQQPLEDYRKADSLGEAVSMGWRETVDGLTMVYRFLNKLVTRQISPDAVGGPLMIASAAFSQASKGLPDLLVFLTMLSANLAVVNFLPIPVLDGGHMVFLMYEGIFRRPMSEKIVGALSTLGLVFLMALMIYVIGMDIGIIERNL